PFTGWDCGVFSARHRLATVRGVLSCCQARLPRRDHQGPRGRNGKGWVSRGKGHFQERREMPFSTPETGIMAVGGPELNSKSSLGSGAPNGMGGPETQRSAVVPSSPGDSAELRASPTGTGSSRSSRPPLAHQPALCSETPLPFVTFYGLRAFHRSHFTTQPSLASFPS
ncbi:hypothetical protein H1C71_040389, partial [Ictidomys tridecemlineatus]